MTNDALLVKAAQEGDGSTCLVPSLGSAWVNVPHLRVVLERRTDNSHTSSGVTRRAPAGSSVAYISHSASTATYEMGTMDGEARVVCFDEVRAC